MHQTNSITYSSFFIAVDSLPLRDEDAVGSLSYTMFSFFVLTALADYAASNTYIITHHYFNLVCIDNVLFVSALHCFKPSLGAACPAQDKSSD